MVILPRSRGGGFPRLRISFWTLLSAGIVIASLAGLLAPVAIQRVQAWGILTQAPRLELSARRIDLGEGAPNEIVRGTLQLRNTGSEPLEFSIERSCGCTELRPSQGTIPAGEAMTIHLGLRLPDHSGSEKSERITIKSNDPERPVVHCRVLARCPAPFEVTPHFVSFGQLLADETARATACIRVKAPTKKPLDDPAELLVDHSSDWLGIQKTIGDNGVVLLTFSIPSKLSPGSYYDTIEIRLRNSDHTMRIPAKLDICEPVSIVPSTVYLRKDAEANGYRSVTLLVVDRRPGSSLGAVRIANSPPGVNIEEINSESTIVAAPRRLRLLFEPEARLPPETRLQLHCEGLANPLTVKLVVLSDTAGAP